MSQISVRGVGDLSHLIYAHTPTFEVSAEVLREHRVIAGMPPGPEADAYRVLRTRVLRRMGEQNFSVLAVTSPSAGVGKSITAINLALCIAMEVSRTVLLIDGDLRKPQLHRLLGLPSSLKGLAEYLADSAPLESCLAHPNVGRVTLLPGGRALQNSSEMLSSPRMCELMQSVKLRYAERVVIVDLPPLLGSDDALGFLPFVDATLLVVEDGVTTREELADCAELLKETPLVGTVLNKCRERCGGY
jgi:capsular exopolysaccharide synthesis family protein